MDDGDDRPDNATLIRRALAGGVAGRQAWDELVRRHARAVWKVLVSFRLSPATGRTYSRRPGCGRSNGSTAAASPTGWRPG